MRNQPERDLLDRADRVTVGASQTNSRRHGLVGPSTYPAFAVSGAGAYLRFVDETVAIDLAGANGAIALGYQPDIVTGALYGELMRGWTLSLPSILEVEVSERMVNALPFPSLVRWVRTGSEAVSAAVAIAQKETGSNVIGVFHGSYHGWHPWIQTAITIDGTPLDDIGELAAIIVESPRWKLVDNDYTEWLMMLREDCTERGVLLVFDDVVYAFRFATGGLQETTRVRPDLACFSKALGNGVPVGCVAGEPDLMRRTGMRVSSTFGGEAMGLAAANAVLRLHAERDICGELGGIAVDLRERLLWALESTPITLIGTPQHFRFSADSTSVLDAFLSRCMTDREDRVLIHREANNANLAMSEAIREKITQTVARAARQS